MCPKDTDGTATSGLHYNRASVARTLMAHLPRLFRNRSSVPSVGGAMVLGKLPVPGRPSNLLIVGQGPTALAVGAGGGSLDILLSSIFSLLFGRRPDID